MSRKKEFGGNNLIKIIVSVILTGLLAYGIYWSVTNWSTLSLIFTGNGANIYTALDLENAHEDGYNEGVEDKEAYVVLIDGYRETILIIQDEKTLLQQQISELTEEDYPGQIESLNEQIAQLEYQLTYYQQLLEAYEQGENFIVTFKIGNEVYDVIFIAPAETIGSLDTPINESYVFNYWEVGGVQIDSSYIVNSNITVNANVTYYRNIQFVVDGEEYDNQTVLEGETVVAPINPEREGYIFVGWFVGSIEFNFETLITTDLIITAVFEEEEETVTAIVISSAGFYEAFTNPEITDIVINGSFEIGTEVSYVETVVEQNITISAGCGITMAKSMTFNGDFICNGSYSTTSRNQTFNGKVTINSHRFQVGGPSSTVVFNNEVVINEAGTLMFYYAGQTNFNAQVTAYDSESIVYQDTNPGPIVFAQEIIYLH